MVACGRRLFLSPPLPPSFLPSFLYNYILPENGLISHQIPSSSPSRPLVQFNSIQFMQITSSTLATHVSSFFSRKKKCSFFFCESQGRVQTDKYRTPMMASFSGPLHRPLSAMAVAAFAAVSSLELPDRLSHHKLADPSSNADSVVSLPAAKPDASAPSASALSGLQFLPRDAQNLHPVKVPFASLPVIQMVYQYAKLVKTSGQEEIMPTISSSSSDALYRWHLPDPRVCGNSLNKSQTVVVLLGWLGSRQKHPKRYAHWYTSRGFHVVTFTLPMSDIVSYNLEGKAEKNVEMLSEHLAGWVREESGKKIIFHTFSNTGWLCYGVILDNLQRQDPSAVDKIKACVVDSAPVAAPDPQVWASGFSAALMKKQKE